FDYYVGTAHQTMKNFPTRLGLEIKSEALLAAIPDRVGGHLAHRVAARRFDFDYFRAVIGKQHPDQGPPPPPGQVENLVALKRPRHRFVLPFSAGNRFIQAPPPSSISPAAIIPIVFLLSEGLRGQLGQRHSRELVARRTPRGIIAPFFMGR